MYAKAQLIRGRGDFDGKHAVVLVMDLAAAEELIDGLCGINQTENSVALGEAVNEIGRAHV